MTHKLYMADDVKITTINIFHGYIFLYWYTPVKFKTTFFPFDQTSIDLYGFIGTYIQTINADLHNIYSCYVNST